MNKNTPAQQGYSFPAEWAKHKATWLSWPHKEASWPGKLDSIFPQYAQFIKLIAEGEEVRINVANAAMEAFARGYIEKAGADMHNVFFHHFPTNDAWCRDHGPAFLVNPAAEQKKVIVDWGYNAWGGKYPPYDLDDVIPTKIAQMYNIPVFHPGIVMEGGSVEFNGRGTLLTSTSCLLNPNRNPSKSREQIEEYLEDYYGVEHILWLGEGIVGDDTDGHIDDITRFVNEDTVVTVVEENKSDDNYFLLKDNLKDLHKMRLENGKQLNVIELPMPSAVIYDDQRLPASYANFYISNNHVVVPTFRDKNDEVALEILQQLFTDRKVTGLDSTDIIWGLGSFHCLSQQEPA
ncbi:agmatine deiminase family protein [Cytophaga hutchinsonii]|uniref:Agmatine deiminase n=1 Tax=Cytophaga hutchinsonii (strain ATCC 33406 / DSM 1761 / CIP 103989 / NBRC 15051 / NCIMB 9469 / D465) TaxID=269798 RepID=A0A6N4SP72_CYTH3|nr:agmatine deiminase family protein [Cytophaga hutchinsonii]ABG58113.1 agmatine deiminase [Cytophaga hutchinsonii ATCC 33406]SFX13814.1 agmatine deiminase [Cytophaga hutchinsonii ATCC 33406]